MPVLNRRLLRQHLGARRLRDVVFGNTTFSPNIGAGSAVTVMHASKFATPEFSGGDLYQRAFLRVGSADYRVGTYNIGSGAFISQTPAAAAFGSGEYFEVSEKLSATEMDAAIDETIIEQRVRQEWGMASIDGARFYDVDLALSGSGYALHRPLDAYYFGAPDSSLNRERRDFNQHEFVATGTGTELRIAGGLGASLQVVVDAILTPTLGAADLATVNLLDEEVVLWGAAMRCYDLLLQRAPSEEVKVYERRRLDATRTYHARLRSFLPDVSKPLTFAPFEHPTRLE